MNTVNIVNLDVCYGARQVLEGVAFSAQPGEMIGICGPNGSGKTTLLRTMSRVIDRSGGRICYAGQDMDTFSFRMLARRVASVPQETAINFDYTVREIVMMGRHPHIGRFSAETPEDRSICERAMRLADVGHLSEMPVNAISGGERQRVLIARALTQGPDILLLDEATSHLDISNQIEILDIIRREMREMTTISVFHDINLAACYCDRIVFLNDRTIVAMGTPAEVLTPGTIRSVFGIDVIVSTHPHTGRPYILPVYDDDADPPKPVRVHVTCGGGSGSALLRTLHRKGYIVSTGILSILDSDHAVALNLGIPVVTEAPFAPISDTARKNLNEYLEVADMIVLCAMPVGQGNIRNISVLEQFAEKTLVLGTIESFEDCTGGYLGDSLSDLMENGAKPVESIGSILLHLGEGISSGRHTAVVVNGR